MYYIVHIFYKNEISGWFKYKIYIYFNDNSLILTFSYLLLKRFVINFAVQSFNLNSNTIVLIEIKSFLNYT